MNKFDINLEMTAQIEAFVKEKNVSVLSAVENSMSDIALPNRTVIFSNILYVPNVDIIVGLPFTLRVKYVSIDE